MAKAGGNGLRPVPVAVSTLQNDNIVAHCSRQFFAMGAGSWRPAHSGAVDTIVPGRTLMHPSKGEEEAVSPLMAMQPNAEVVGTEEKTYTFLPSLLPSSLLPD